MKRRSRSQSRRVCHAKNLDHSEVASELVRFLLLEPWPSLSNRQRSIHFNAQRSLRTCGERVSGQPAPHVAVPGRRAPLEQRRRVEGLAGGGAQLAQQHQR